ncbi:MAG: hypothetical protein IPP94_10510 [Ignavibacteria bacterium]|nr:hypothetical protein [Ignavibacteria bacterium]
MNAARMRRLAAEGHVELTRKMARRFARDGIVIGDIVAALAESELKDENVLAYPDFACTLGIRSKERTYDLVCVQCTDGRAARIVGYFNRATKNEKKAGTR